MKKLLLAGLACVLAFGMVGCKSSADKASRNLSTAAEEFELERRLVFYNAERDVVILEVIGFCSVEYKNNKSEIVCKEGDGTFKRHGMGNNDRVTMFYQQLEGKLVSTYHTRMVFKPQNIILDVDLMYDGKQLKEAVTPDNDDK